MVLLGPRQVGKTTLARTLAKDWPDDAAYLERPADRLRLEDADTYVRDSGLLHGLLELETLNHLLGHPVCGLGHGRAGDWFCRSWRRCWRRIGAKLSCSHRGICADSY